MSIFNSVFPRFPSEITVSGITISGGASANATLISDASGTLSYVKNNFTSAVAPTVNDDSTAGYRVGSKWFDIVAPDGVYQCIDATPGAAVWKTSTLTLDDLGSMALQNSNAIQGISTGVNDIPLSVKGFAGQVASLSQWKNSADNIMLRVDSSGLLSWGTALGAVTHISGPSDQALRIAAISPVQVASTVVGNALSLRGANATAGASVDSAAVGGEITLTGGNAASRGAAASYAAVGGAVTLLGGTGVGGNSTGGEGGALNLTGGTAGANSIGGAVNITGGTGTGGSTGGDINITAGAGPGKGQINITSGVGANSYSTRPNHITIKVSDSTQIGGTVGTLFLTGAQANFRDNTTRVGGPITITTLPGSTAAAGDTNNGGAGGAITINLGAGGLTVSNISGSGGVGAPFTINGGAGGVASGASGTHVGGAGSTLTLTSGAGGNATGGSGSRTGGNSGDVVIGIGAVGTGATANGTAGKIRLNGDVLINSNPVIYNISSQVGSFCSPNATLGAFTNATVFGIGASINGAAGNYGTAFGNLAVCSSSLGNAFGYNANADVAGTAIGANTNAGQQAVMIGGRYTNSLQTKTGNYSVGVGCELGVTGTGSTAIGYAATCAYAGSIVLGRGATALAVKQFVVGNANYAIENAYLGCGITSPTPTTITLNASGAQGTDLAGAAIAIAGGKGTGTGAGGAIEFWTADPLTTGTTLQTITKKGQWNANGTLTIGAITLPKVDGTANQVLKTNGSGVVAWANQSGGFESANAAGTTPVASDVSTWTDGASGIVIGTGGRRFLVNKKDADEIFAVELGAV